MREIIKDSIMIGLGIAALGRKKLTKVYKTLKDEGEAFSKEIPMIKKCWEKVNTISDRIDELRQNIIKRLNIATCDELSELNKKIEKILKQISVAD